MNDHYIELVLDGSLTQADVEEVVRRQSVADRETKGNAFDSGGWNNLTVLFRHRHAHDLLTVTEARAFIQDHLDTGDGIAVQVTFDGAESTIPTAPPVQKPVVAPPVAVTVAAPAIVPAPAAIAPEPNETAPPVAEVEPEPEFEPDPQFEDSEDAAPLLARKAEIAGKLLGFADDIIKRMHGQVSKTRGCQACGSQIAVAFITSHVNETGVSGITCPVCVAEDFCVFETDQKRRESLLGQMQKVDRQIGEGRTAFEAAHPPVRKPIAPVIDETVEAALDAVSEPDAPEEVTPPAIPDVVPPPETATVTLTDAAEENPLTKTEPVIETGRTVWLVGGYVFIAA